ncbi:MAG: Unknown protein [uncultured Sulfurovum sp.]|uniref:Uncharacterized protein n=1 Tax=uncultured Sulfurovum sp. TaxID=269237 RepID=A0A6S6SN78_9BACT|nr:MAG: Unknown protein [uncultured Sulfurovum sp.]
MGTKVEDITGIVWDNELTEPKATEPEALKPLGREYSTQEKSYLRSLGTRIGRFEDPERISLATKALSSGATPATLGALIGGLQREEVAEKKEQALTLDRKKISQNIVKKWAGLETAGKHLESLMDNYDSSNVGAIDSMDSVQWVKRQFGIGDTEKRSNHDAAISGIESSLKDAFGFGANYALNEQALMRKYMPTISDGEESYKNQIYTSAKNLKKELSSKINMQNLAGYESKDLKNMLGKLDSLIVKADGFRGNNKEEKSPKPTKLRSLRQEPKPTSTPNQATTMSREEKIKLLQDL